MVRNGGVTALSGSKRVVKSFVLVGQDDKCCTCSAVPAAEALTTCFRVFRTPRCLIKLFYWNSVQKGLFEGCQACALLVLTVREH
jgi:hypothetical protein